MKKIITCLFFVGLLFGTTHVDAQKWAVGARGGVSIPNLSSAGQENSPINQGYSSTLRPDGAVFGEYFLPASRFSIKAMLSFSGQGGKKNGLQAFPSEDIIDKLPPDIPPSILPQYLYANYKSRARLNYLMLPIMGKYELPLGSESPWAVYGEVGPFVSFLMSAKQITSGTSAIFIDPEGKNAPEPDQLNSFDATNNTRSSLHKGNAGITGNVGFSYKVNRSFIFIEGGGNFGFVKVQKDKKFGLNNAGAATVDLGYGIKL